jgi:hypothetical protein
MSGFSKSKKSPVTVRGPWFAMPLEFLRSRTFAGLSLHASKLLLDLCSQLGPNSRRNGDLCASRTVLEPRGWTSETTLAASLAELKSAGLLCVTRQGNKRRASLYAVTLWPMDCDFSKLDTGPGCYSTKDWEEVSPGANQPPSVDRPARWAQPRKNENAPPMAGSPPRVKSPPREQPKPTSQAITATVGAKGPKSSLNAHSTDRGHPFQTDRGQHSRRSRTPWAGCLSDGPDGRATVRDQFGTLSAISVERGLPGGQPGAEGGLDAFGGGCSSLVHGGGVACDEQPPRWARRGRSGTRPACLGCRQAGCFARRSDSPFSARVCEPCSSRSMMASAMVGSLSH